MDTAMQVFVLIGIALVTFNGVRIGSDIGIFDPFFVAGGLVWILIFLGQPERGVVLPKTILFAFVFFAIFGLLSCVLSDQIRDSLIGYLRLAVASVGIPLIVGSAFQTERANRVAAAAWVLFAGVNGYVGISDLLFGTNIGQAFTGGTQWWVGRTPGLTTHPNHLGLTCVMAMPVAIALITSAKARAQWVVAVVALAGLQAGIIASGSRAEIVAEAVVFFLLGFLHKSLRSRLLLLAVVGVVALGMLGKIDHSGLETIAYGWRRLTGSVSIGDSDQVRLQYYAQAIRNFFSAPVLGVGFQDVRKAHNIYLQLLQASGAVGFIGFFAYILSYLRVAFRLRRAWKPTDPERLMVVALLISIAVWLFVGLAQNEVYDRYIYVPFGLLLGLRRIAGYVRIRGSNCGMDIGNDCRQVAPGA